MKALRLFVVAFVAIISTSLAVQAQDFPLTIEHKFGASIIPEMPERVATLDFTGADNLLALGVQPVTVRYWYGDYPRAVWPWADALLEGSPEILRGDLNFEQIASTSPDVIIAIASGISADDYEKLSLIAPVVAVPEGKGDYELSWAERIVITGRAIGKEAEAVAKMEAIRDRLSAVADTHPEWAGKSTVLAYATADGQTGGYTSYDMRSQILSDMGFSIAPAVDDVLGGEYSFYVYFSPEEIFRLDSDLLIWFAASDKWEPIRELPGRTFLQATQEGRDLFVGRQVASAFSHGSLLSLPFAIDSLVPMIEAALDGDPRTYADDRPGDLVWTPPNS